MPEAKDDLKREKVRTAKMTFRALVASCLRVLQSCLWSEMWS